MGKQDYLISIIAVVCYSCCFVRFNCTTYFCFVILMWYFSLWMCIALAPTHIAHNMVIMLCLVPLCELRLHCFTRFSTVQSSLCGILLLYLLQLSHKWHSPHCSTPWNNTVTLCMENTNLNKKKMVTLHNKIEFILGLDQNIRSVGLHSIFKFE